jgi:flagellar protein FlaG
VPAATTTNVDDKALHEALTRAQQVVHQVDPRIQIEIDQDLHRPVMKVVDNQTGTVIRQIPAEEMLDIAKRLDAVEGILFKGRV